MFAVSLMSILQDLSSPNFEVQVFPVIILLGNTVLDKILGEV